MTHTPIDDTASESFSPLDSDDRPTRIRWIIFALSCASSFVLYLHRYTWNFIGPALEEEYGFSKTEVGSLYSVFYTAYSLGQIPSGIICDLFGPHVFLGSSIVLWSLMLPCHGFVTGLGALSAVRLLFGIAQAGAYPALTKVTANWFPLRSRTAIQGWIATFFGRGGGAVSPIIMATVLIGLCGFTWQTALLIMGLSGVGIGGLFLVLFRNRPESDARVNAAELRLIQEGSVPVSNTGPRVLPWRAVVRNRSMRYFIVQQFSYAGADTVYATFMGAYFMQAKGFNIAEAGLLVSLPLWGGAFGGIFGGYCNDWLIRATGSRRWGRSLIGFFGMMLACVMMFVALNQESGHAAAWAMFAVKFFCDTNQPTGWGVCTDLGGRFSATVFSIINTSGTLGGVVMPVLFGVILDRSTSETTIDGIATATTNYAPMFMAVAGMYVFSALCWLAIDCTKSLEQTWAESQEQESQPN